MHITFLSRLNTSATRRQRRQAGLAAVVVFTLLLGGCASRPPPPNAQITEAQAAVDSAVRAGAAAAASTELAMARDKLARANASIVGSQHERALMLAEAALVDARLAEAKTRQAQAAKAAGAVQEDSRVLRQEIERGAAQ